MNQNADGGWGDTDKSFSNISTTLLVKSALILSRSRDLRSRTLPRADDYIESQGGIEAVKKRYGKDLTFSVPILTNAALAGLVPWESIPQLPFERAAAPRILFRLLNLQVVSYAIPALVAIGQVRFHHVPQPCGPLSWLRRLTKKRTLKLIETMQPESGGYLEAAPLTSFVAMSLVACDLAEHPVVTKCVRFLLDTVRDDGSWPIDTNLATWATSLAINALGKEGLVNREQGTDSDAKYDDASSLLPAPCSLLPLIDWLLSCQHRVKHPFTGADHGGWGWTDLSGAVPDADDTPGALLALAELWPTIEDDNKRNEILQAAEWGLKWLCDLQNSDGGIPTFCRGWGLLPFDQSSTDLTAHALRAFVTWSRLPINLSLGKRMYQSLERMLYYLFKQQNADGSWHPLWFGNQHQPGGANPFYGTAKVLRGLIADNLENGDDIENDIAASGSSDIRRGIRWIVANQNADGGWGGDGLKSSVEETAVIVETLACFVAGYKEYNIVQQDELSAYHRGLEWLLDAVESDRWTEPSPIGLYFASLWYYEELYPIVFTVSALRQAIINENTP